jgi:cytochrome P450
VVSESLRLYPPAAAIARVSAADDEIGEVKIPAGSLVMISPWVLHRHAKLWSEPEAFDPSRFLADKPLAHHLAYLPFGAGPRVCVAHSLPSPRPRWCSRRWCGASRFHSRTMCRCCRSP